MCLVPEAVFQTALTTGRVTATLTKCKTLSHICCPVNIILPTSILLSLLSMLQRHNFHYSLRADSLYNLSTSLCVGGRTLYRRESAHLDRSGPSSSTFLERALLHIDKAFHIDPYLHIDTWLDRYPYNFRNKLPASRVFLLTIKFWLKGPAGNILRLLACSE